MKKFGITVFLISILGVQTTSSEELFDIKSANEHFNNGLTLYFESQYDEAIQEFNKSLKINPGFAKAYYFIGYSHYEKGNFKDSSRAFETAYKISSDYSPKPPSETKGVPVSSSLE